MLTWLFGHSSFCRAAMLELSQLYPLISHDQYILNTALTGRSEQGETASDLDKCRTPYRSTCQGPAAQRASLLAKRVTRK